MFILSFSLSFRSGGRASPFHIPQLPEISPHPFTLLFHPISALFFSVLQTAVCIFLEFLHSLIEQQKNCLAKSDRSIPQRSSTPSLSHLMFVFGLFKCFNLIMITGISYGLENGPWIDLRGPRPRPKVVLFDCLTLWFQLFSRTICSQQQIGNTAGFISLQTLESPNQCVAAPPPPPPRPPPPVLFWVLPNRGPIRVNHAPDLMGERRCHCDISGLFVHLFYSKCFQTDSIQNITCSSYIVIILIY